MMNSAAQNVLRAEALRLVGSHYLTGATGAIPDGYGGNPARERGVASAPLSFDPKKPCIHAAETAFIGKSVCAGRYQSFAGGRTVTDPDVMAKYLQQEEERYKKSGKVECFYEYYTPRIPWLKGNAGGAVWGEDCRGKRHFDCVGLVNYLLTMVCNLGATFGRIGFSADIELHYNATKKVQMDAPPVSGDLLFPIKTIVPPAPADHPETKEEKAARLKKATPAANLGHIAVLLGNGQVVQAADPGRGVIIGAYHPKDWFVRGRYYDELFMDISG